jgi:hypothetical protein
MPGGTGIYSKQDGNALSRPRTEKGDGRRQHNRHGTHLEMPQSEPQVILEKRGAQRGPLQDPMLVPSFKVDRLMRWEGRATTTIS